MFQNFQAWKLHSFSDYLVFFLVILTGVFLIKFFIRRIHDRRNDAHALKIVQKKLSFPAQEARIYHDVTLTLAGNELHYDHLLIDAAGIIALRSIGWGTRIYGQADQPIWKVADNKTETTMKNPVAELSDTFEALRRRLATAEIYGLSIEPLIIFADPFTTPVLNLGRDSSCITLDGLSEWKKQRRLRAKLKSQKADIAAISAVIEESIKR